MKRTRKDKYDEQMLIAEDLDRFGLSSEAKECRDDAFNDRINPEYWYHRTLPILNGISKGAE